MEQGMGVAGRLNVGVSGKLPLTKIKKAAHLSGLSGKYVLSGTSFSATSYFGNIGRNS